jgi:hypothetical protein
MFGVCNLTSVAGMGQNPKCNGVLLGLQVAKVEQSSKGSMQCFEKIFSLRSAQLRYIFNARNSLTKPGSAHPK